MKRKTIATLAAALTATLALLTPSIATAAPINPDGSTPYGANTYCAYPVGYNPDRILGADPADATCSTIPTGTAWTTPEIPLPAPNNSSRIITPSFTGFSWVQTVQPEGGVSWTTDTNPRTYDRGFFVQPASAENIPFLVSADLATFGYNSENTTIQNVTAQVVADDYTNFEISTSTGTVTQTVPAGNVTTANITELAADSYTIDFALGSPTWQERTNGTLNSFGWAGHILVQVEATRDGNPFIDTTAYYFTFQAPSMADIQNLSPEIVLAPGEVGGITSSYSFLGRTGVTPSAQPQPEPEPQPQPEPQPEPEEPPVVIPPVVTPPAVTPDPEPQAQPQPEPERPIINTGDASEQLPVQVFFALGAVLLFGAGAIWFFSTRREDATE